MVPDASINQLLVETVFFSMDDQSSHAWMWSVMVVYSHVNG